ncbi:hypothetical protein SPRG_10746 [Saprolegnia parasitica CBS 223.65]|uniref:Uncharacterized protein n=1 Tax=Saprolegnia parasitica (strain CBS 223.65) TaxID=695850 RepID=A0A067BYE6_SAPPC|nr:hypothetical protein SPRG_10746 [Saprolegnia parasitica CBS 223.65]KDO23554.1 hypothetical protein SPRG_10746 [Saprolegnia parasitica CBS 223.65]|eukprot:XP_012205704.1 hypothetical protein SPRG_10746 [Saprolegnia parasitica CBS 223.65]
MEQLQRRVFDMESMNTRLKALVDELQWKMVSHGFEREVHECHAQAGIVVNGNHIAMQSPRRKPKAAKPTVAKEPQATPKAAFPSPHTAPIRPQFSEQRLFPPPNAAAHSSRAPPYMYPPLVPPPREYTPRQEVQLESHVSALLGLQFSQPAAKPEPPPPSSYPPFPSQN